jgi:hypothetical protein
MGGGYGRSVQYEVLDVSTWPVMSQEARGVDPKDWITRPEAVRDEGQEHLWLFKPVKHASYRRYDDVAEKVACELAALLGLPSARVELARGQHEEGIVSRNVTPNQWEIDSGDVLLYETPGYLSCAGDDRPKNRVGHNLTNIAAALDTFGGPPESPCTDWTAMEVFTGFLVFDAWIANTDRHAMNWGFLTHTTSGEHRLAPSFDHGSALASGVPDDRLATTNPTEFCARGRATRFEDGAKTTLVDLALAAVAQTGGESTVWLDRLRAVMERECCEVLDAVPTRSVERHRFLSTVLTNNQRRLAP